MRDDLKDTLYFISQKERKGVGGGKSQFRGANSTEGKNTTQHRPKTKTLDAGARGQWVQRRR